MVGRLELEKIEAAAEETKIKIEFCSEEMTQQNNIRNAK